MALTRAQLLMGNSSQGVVLAGQTQGVRQGVGVIIAADGTISFDSTTATGVLKTNNPTAYNAYVWPTTLGAVGQQLQLGAAGALSWEDPDQIPWTAKGQLIAGTGVGTSTLLNVGVDGSILIADSTQASGLGYTTNFVATTGATSAANIPAGPVGSRPGSPIAGQLRFSTTSGEMEFWDGTSWQTIAGSATGLFVDKTANNGSAVIPAGTQAQRDSSPGAGYFRYDSTLNAMEFFDGTIWQVVVASASGNIFATLAQAQAGTIATLAATPETAVPKDASGMTGSAYIPAGTTAQRPTASNYTGQFRYNTQIPQLEYSDGAAWQPVVAPGGGVTSFSAGTTGLTPAAATSGAITLGGTLAIANGGTGQATATAGFNALAPSQAGNAGKFLTTDGTNTSWVAAGGAGTVTSIDVSGGTTGLTFSGGPVTASGTITMAGQLALASGGTGSGTQAGAANNILPSQGGNSGKYLTTDGSNVSWVAAGAAGTVTNVTGTSPISVATGTTTPVVSIATGAVSSIGALGLDPTQSTIINAGSGLIRAQNLYNATGTVTLNGVSAGGTLIDFQDGGTSKATLYGPTATFTVAGTPGGGSGYQLNLSGGGILTLSENAAGPGQLICTGSALFIGGNSGSAIVVFQDGGGTNIAQILTAGGVYQALSDERVKTDIEDCTYGLSQVMQLRPVTYRFKDRGGEHFDARHIGFIAQEVDPIIDEAVCEMPQEDGEIYLGLSYQDLIPVLTKAIQELKQEFDDYKAAHP